MIDWARIEELRRDFGEDDFAEIVEEFLEEVQEKLASLQSARSSDLAADFHFLKGSAANLGFRALQAACGTAELDPHPKFIPEICDLFEASKAEFFQRLDTAA